MPKYLSFVKGVMGSDDLLPLNPLNVSRDTLQESNIIKVISKKIVRKAIEILCKLSEKDKSREEKDDGIGGDTKEVNINKNGEVVEKDSDKLVVDAANDAPPPPQEAPTTTTTTAAAVEKCGDDDDVDSKDGDEDDKADDIKGGGREGAILQLKTETTKRTKTRTKRT